MENPAVNPITGPGRTTADVARELRAYKHDVRANALNAVFQADFLFVERLPGLTLALHRVVHNACIRDAAMADISFTTVEYEHHAQPGIPVFWEFENQWWHELRPGMNKVMKETLWVWHFV